MDGIKDTQSWSIEQMGLGNRSMGGGGFFFVMISESMSKVRGLLVQNRVFSLRIGLFK